MAVKLARQWNSLYTCIIKRLVILIFKMRLSKEKIAEKRAIIINKGRDLMVRQGYAKTGVSEIAKEVGMPKGSFFNYFKSKEDFAVRTLEVYTQDALGWMRESLRNEDLGPLERLRTYYANNVETLTRKLEYKGGCLLNILSLELGEDNEVVSAAVKTSYQTLLDEIAHCIRLAQAAGEVDARHDPDRLAVFIDNAWRGLLTTSKSSKNRAAADAFMEYVFEFCLK